MLIPELLENLPNDVERLLYLDGLKKQLEEQEKAIKSRLLHTKPKHSQIKYVERKIWEPSEKYNKGIKELDLQKKDLIEESKVRKMGTFKVTNYIQISKPKAPKEEPKSSINSQNYSDFFLS